jgi:hypothetical protein
MPGRKESTRRQFTMRPGVLEPGEQVVTGLMVQTGASPLLAGMVGILPFLLGETRAYYLALTDRRVLFLKASMVTMRPKGMGWADPRGSVVISDIVSDATLWNRFLYHRPGVTEPLRVNVSAVRWNPEFHTLVANLEAVTRAITADPPMPPPPGP